MSQENIKLTLGKTKGKKKKLLQTNRFFFQIQQVKYQEMILKEENTMKKII